MNLGHLTITLLSLLGLGISIFIFLRNKRFGKKLHLPKPDRSFFQMSHGRLFGIPFEILGIGYYGILFLSYLVFLILPQGISEALVFEVFFISGLGVFFSVVLLVIEAFVIRKFCLLCTLSAILCGLIFGIGVFEIPIDLLQVLSDGRSVLIVIHLFAMVLGLGGATYSDILLMRFLKDLKISKKEAEVLETLGQVIWVGVGFAVVSGVGLFLPEAQRLLETPKFLAKNIIFLILMINGALLHLYVLPHILQVSFHERTPLKHLSIRTAAFVMGAISASSWYSVFLLGGFKNVPLSLSTILLIYLGVVVCAIGISLNLELFFVSKATSTSKKK